MWLCLSHPHLLAGAQAPWVASAVATSHCGRDLERELGPALAPLFWFDCLNAESTQWPRLERGDQGGAASGQAGPKTLSPTAG